MLWNSSAEHNTSIFELQRSTDGVSFEKAASIAAAANNSNSRYYSFNDNIAGLFQNAFYYRLKMIDPDGSFSFSDIVKINLAGKGFSAIVTPNPFWDVLKVNIETSSPEKADVVLRDMGGRNMWQTVIVLQKGTNAVRIDRSGKFPAGIYMLTVKTARQKQTIKVVKQ